MKKQLCLYLIISILLIAVTLSSAGLNTKDSNEEDHIVSLKLMGHAHDNSSDYVFKMPFNITPLEDGSFFLIDNTQVLKFDNSCKFLKIVISKGVGPKEALYINQIFEIGNKIIVNTGIMGKIIIIDKEGNLLGEYQRSTALKPAQKNLKNGNTAFNILGNTKDMELIIIDYNSSWNEKDKKKGICREPVLLLSSQNELIKFLFEIPVKSNFIETPFGIQAVVSFNLISTHDSERIYYCNSMDYNINIYNIHENKLEKSWKRPYTHIRIPENEKGKYNYGSTFVWGSKDKKGKYESGANENFPDIQGLHLVGNKLWVITSTVKKGKGVLIDVFDKKGNYTDHFFLDLKGKVDLYKLDAITISDSFVYIRELDEEDNYLIAKYMLNER